MGRLKQPHFPCIGISAGVHAAMLGVYFLAGRPYAPCHETIGTISGISVALHVCGFPHLDVPTAPFRARPTQGAEKVVKGESRARAASLQGTETNHHHLGANPCYTLRPYLCA